MVKTIPLFFFSFFLFGCGNQDKADASQEPATETEILSKIDRPDIGGTNYAVIWSWSTDDTQLVYDNSVIVANELTELWKKGVVENAYYDTESKADRLEYFPNIAFFMIAQSEDEAERILDALTIVNKGIATYALHPVGQLWLGRNDDMIQKIGIKKSFATIWTTNVGTNPSLELVKEQNDRMLELWKSGLVENVYFDFEGTHTKNDKTDFVFFVNADSEAQARSICDALPFSIEELTTYRIHEAGVFWMGLYQNK